jgi:hypothetical protein
LTLLCKSPASRRAGRVMRGAFVAVAQRLCMCQIHNRNKWIHGPLREPPMILTRGQHVEDALIGGRVSPSHGPTHSPSKGRRTQMLRSRALIGSR